MKPENLNMEEITEARRKAFAASIRTIGLEELKALGEKLFPFVGDPWREKFFAFLDENPGATFHHATAHDGVQVVYCHAQGQRHLVPAENRLWTRCSRGAGRS